MKNMDGALGPSSSSNNFTNKQKGVVSSDKAHKYYRMINSEVSAQLKNIRLKEKHRNRRSKTHLDYCVNIQ